MEDKMEEFMEWLVEILEDISYVRIRDLIDHLKSKSDEIEWILLSNG